MRGGGNMTVELECLAGARRVEAVLEPGEQTMRRDTADIGGRFQGRKLAVTEASVDAGLYVLGGGGMLRGLTRVMDVRVRPRATRTG
jgi:hypothetical protein